MLKSNLNTTSYLRWFSKIDEKIMDKSNYPVFGEGAFIKRTGGNGYAHIKLKINIVENEEYIGNKAFCIWSESINKNIIFLFRHHIEEVLSLFAEYYFINNDENSLEFEILGGGFHPVDSGRKYHWQKATLNALRNAFDKRFESDIHKTSEIYEKID